MPQLLDCVGRRRELFMVGQPRRCWPDPHLNSPCLTGALQGKAQVIWRDHWFHLHLRDATKTFFSVHQTYLLILKGLVVSRKSELNGAFCLSCFCLFLSILNLAPDNSGVCEDAPASLGCPIQNIERNGGRSCVCSWSRIGSLKVRKFP